MVPKTTPDIYKFFFNHSYDLNCIANNKGYFEIISPNWISTLGYTEKELLEKPFLDYVHPDDVNMTLKEMEKIEAGANTINFINRYRKKDGDYIYIEWNATPDPQTEKLYAIARNVTERIRKDASLKAIFDSAVVSIIKTDKNGIITHFSKGSEYLLGYKAEEMVGIHTPELIHVEKQVMERSHELSKIYGQEIKGFDVFIEYAKQGKHESREWTYVRKDGTTFPVQLVVSAVSDEYGAKDGYLGIATDISDLKKAKYELEALVDHLQKQNNQLLNFAYVTSHNLRSPVSNLNSLLNFYKESINDGDKQMLLTKFETVVTHLSSTLNELIESLKSRVDLSKEREFITFGNVYSKLNETLAGQIIETKAEITFDFEAAKNIKYPKSYLESIMLNLLSNALKYRFPGRTPLIHFQTDIVDNEVVLSVRDNGLGIDLEKYGSELFGLNKTFHDHPDSKGVGLYITKTQVEAMGGQILVESEVDKGTVFKVYFDKDT
ncbi:MAG TPA: PAS domain S-box protein [Fulvivirga sp.]|nr:PAS domain S-box protein [Fulvivirga sp.]